MLSKNIEASPKANGRVYNWTNNASVYRVIEVIEENIRFFVDKYVNNQAEKYLNQNFSICMNMKSKDELFTFVNGYGDSVLATPYEVDFGIVIDGEHDAFFAIEAKRLDCTLPIDRKKEYIIGKLGGIERFKREKHGKSLTHVGMIGYVQSDNFDTWFKKINDWIDEEINTDASNELIWESRDKLIPDKQETVFNTYLSEHKCISKEKINMYHIWVDLT